MVEIPEQLASLFSGTVEKHDGRYIIEVPEEEVDLNTIDSETTYRVGILPHPDATTPEPETGTESTELEAADREPGPPTPPVDEGEVRTVTIESIGDQGDGIAKVERGYVVIVPETEPGQEPTVEVERVKQNVAFATVVES